MITQAQKPEQIAAIKQGKARKFFRRAWTGVKVFTAAVLISGIINTSDSYAQTKDTTKVKGDGENELVLPKEKVGLYPNFSFQGVFGNPAYFADLGDWGYASANFDAKEKPTGTLQLSKGISGFQLNVAHTSGNAWMLNGSFKLLENVNVGATFTSANTKGVMGIIYRPVHNEMNMTQVGAQYNLGTGTGKIAAETRQQFGLVTATVSGQMTFDGKGIVNKGFGLQGEVYGFRTSVGFSGDGFKTINLTEQVNLGNGVLPEAGVIIMDGKVVGGWIGVLKAF